MVETEQIAGESVASSASAEVGVSESCRCPFLQCAQRCVNLLVFRCQPGSVSSRASGKGWGFRSVGLVKSPVLTDSGELFPVQASSPLGSRFRLASFRRRLLEGRPGSAIEAAIRKRRQRGTGESQAVGQELG